MLGHRVGANGWRLLRASTTPKYTAFGWPLELGLNDTTHQKDNKHSQYVFLYEWINGG